MATEMSGSFIMAPSTFTTADLSPAVIGTYTHTHIHTSRHNSGIYKCVNFILFQFSSPTGMLVVVSGHLGDLTVSSDTTIVHAQLTHTLIMKNSTSYCSL